MGGSHAHSRRGQSLSEEIANSVSHGAGLLGAITGTPFLIVAAAREGDPAYVAGATVFCAAMLVMYSASTVYHALPHGRIKRLSRVLDHSAIFLLIAGTYTPFTLGVLRNPVGWPLFALVWVLAIVGVGMKAFGRSERPVLSSMLYLAMGWVVLPAADSLVATVPPAAAWPGCWPAGCPTRWA